MPASDKSTFVLFSGPCGEWIPFDCLLRLHSIKNRESKLLFFSQLCHYYMYIYIACLKSTSCCWINSWSYWDICGDLPLFFPRAVSAWGSECYLENKKAAKKKWGMAWLRRGALRATRWRRRVKAAMWQGCSLWSWGDAGACWPGGYSPSETPGTARRNTLGPVTLAKPSRAVILVQLYPSTVREVWSPKPSPHPPRHHHPH